MDDDATQTGQSAIIALPDDSRAMTALKVFIAPIAVSLLVGAGSSYLTAQEALARFDERQQSQGEQITEVEDDVEELQSSERELAEQINRLSFQIDRLEEIQQAQEGNE